MLLKILVLKLIGALIVYRCILGPNLNILNWIDQLRRGQTQTMGKFWLSGYLWHRGSRSIAPETKGTVSKLFYTSGPNLVILNGWKVVARASLGLTHTYTRTHRHRDASNYNTRRPKLTWGKKKIHYRCILDRIYPRTLNWIHQIFRRICSTPGM